MNNKLEYYLIARHILNEKGALTSALNIVDSIIEFEREYTERIVLVEKDLFNTINLEHSPLYRLFFGKISLRKFI